MFPINPLFDTLPEDTGMKMLLNGSLANPLDQAREDDYVTKKELYLACVRYGIGIVAMKPYAGGHLLTNNNPSSIAFTPVQCINRQAISS